MLIFAFSRFKVVLNVDRDECVGDDGQGLPWDRRDVWDFVVVIVTVIAHFLLLADDDFYASSTND